MPTSPLRHPSPISRFLPSDFNDSLPVAVIAGRGIYPQLTVAGIRYNQIPVRLIALEEETKEALIDSFPQEERAIIKVAQLNKLLKTLKKWDIGYVIMAGQVKPKRLFNGLHLDLKAVRLLASLKERNAETLFGGVCTEIEKQGVQLLDARAFIGDHLADEGMMTGGKLDVKPHYIEHGIHITREVARLNIGQGVVVRKGTVLAVEGFEGTDAMLRRCKGFETDQKIFIKSTKLNQDYRFDVPCFGMTTLEAIKEGGVHLVCLEADKTVILEKEKTLKQAKKWDITIWGYR